MGDAALVERCIAVDVQAQALTQERSPLILASGGSTASEVSPMMACSRASQVCSMWSSEGRIRIFAQRMR